MSQDPWARAPTQNNRQDNEQTGSGTAPTQPPEPPTATQGEPPLPPQPVQETVTRQVMAPTNQGSPMQHGGGLQNFMSSLGAGPAPGYPAAAAYEPVRPVPVRSGMQQSWASQYGVPTGGMGGYGHSIPVPQYGVEGIVAAIVLRQIDESPPQVRLVFALLEQYTGVNRAYLGMGMHHFLSHMRRLMH